MRTNFKIIVTLVAARIFFSCGNGKEVVTTDIQIDSTAVEVEELSFRSGIIRDMSADGCGFMIEITNENGDKSLLEPMPLKAEDQVDGKEIVFSYTVSRRQSKCELPSVPIIIQEIK